MERSEHKSADRTYPAPFLYSSCFKDSLNTKKVLGLIRASDLCRLIETP